MMSKNKRKNYFIKKKFQTTFFARFAILLLLEGIFIAALFMYMSRGTLTASYHGTAFTLQKTNAFFMLDIIVIVLIVGAAITIAGIFVFIYLSHRIGGALYRFEKTLEEARNGNISQRVTLRKTDELMDLKNKFNLFLEEIDKRVSHSKNEVDQGLSLLRDMKGSDTVDNIKKTLNKIKTSLEHFKTSK